MKQFFKSYGTGSTHDRGYSVVWNINNNGQLDYGPVNYTVTGARPVFWISLE